MFQARLSSRLAGRLPRVAQASFHQTAPVYVKVGDSIPDLDALVENSPGNKVNLSKELTGKGLIIGVPAAFSTSIPEFRSPDFRVSLSFLSMAILSINSHQTKLPLRSCITTVSQPRVKLLKIFHVYAGCFSWLLYGTLLQS